MQKDVVHHLRSYAADRGMIHLQDWRGLTATMEQAASEIEKLRKALREINRWNDHPGRYSEPLQRILDEAVDTSDVKFD